MTASWPPPAAPSNGDRREAAAHVAALVAWRDAHTLTRAQQSVLCRSLRRWRLRAAGKDKRWLLREGNKRGRPTNEEKAIMERGAV